ncbi:unnamed protein product [Rangifer tarandus platyrhynchus]|uniref:Uncharacterized protein n=1 Tax=Rangifer tarandus platyrhynchus TaxID=3082113 RepID=A0ABN8XMS9_RANTA|nr:unnamed protein product [Rangifer tarandus platyrhynchus]
MFCAKDGLSCCIVRRVEVCVSVEVLVYEFWTEERAPDCENVCRLERREKVLTKNSELTSVCEYLMRHQRKIQRSRTEEDCWTLRHDYSPGDPS